MSGNKWNEWNSIQTHVSNFEYSNVNVKVCMHIYIWFWPRKVEWFKLMLWYLGSPILRLIVNLWLCALDKSFYGMDHYHPTKHLQRIWLNGLNFWKKEFYWLCRLLTIMFHDTWWPTFMNVMHCGKHHPFEFCCCSINVSEVFNISWSILNVLHIACLSSPIVDFHTLLMYAHGCLNCREFTCFSLHIAWLKCRYVSTVEKSTMDLLTLVECLGGPQKAEKLSSATLDVHFSFKLCRKITT